MSDYRETVRGILAMLACCLSFILNDTMVKAATETLPLGQVIFFRGIVSTLVIAVVAWRMGAFHGWRSHISRPLGWRTFGEVGATLAYLTALMHMPIANASAIAQAAPLMITAAGALFLGEQVGWRRWTAVVIGFVGILIIVRPGAEGFNLYALLALFSVVLVVVRDLSTRAIPARTPTIFITAFTSLAVMLTGAGYAAMEDWGPIGPQEALLLVGSGVFLLGGYVFIIIAMRHGDVSMVAPFRYSFIPFAIATGWLVWGDVPDGPTILGIAIVIGTGVYTFYRERKRAQLLAAETPPAVA
ncbi:DMT family transporter [Chthonobacter albigriseus]|uniref:DMT family transporter n=1 Tax=Chthonobacter albigriseus TaxID=1683161 RepID=UPI0015EE6AAA|nr:DMT family transporter [Chthonobacter albigriseus]